MKRLAVFVLTSCLSACASAERQDVLQVTAAQRQFENAWAERVLGDEYATVGEYDPGTDSWDVISIIRQPDQTWQARRTEMRRNERSVASARSSTCGNLDRAIDELQHLPPPSMRPLDLNQSFTVASDPPDVRLRVHTFSEDGDAPVKLVTVETRSDFASPVFWWHARLLEATANCWAQEARG